MTITEATERLHQRRFSLENDLYGLTQDPTLPFEVRLFLRSLEAAAQRGDFNPIKEEEEEDDDDKTSRKAAIEAIKTL